MKIINTKDYTEPYPGYMDNDFIEINRKWREKTYGTPDLDWYIDENNRQWHQTYFARKAVMDHQAKNNCRLAMVCLEYMESKGWLKEGDTILDPMCGIASLLIVASLRGYNCIGVELEEIYYNDMIGYDKKVESDSDDLFANQIDRIQGNLEQFGRATNGVKGVGKIRVFNYDSRKLDIAPFPIETTQNMFNVISSPPYMAATEQTAKQASTVSAYSGHKEHVYTSGNPALLDGSQYRREMNKIYTALYNVLMGGSHVCLLTRNCLQQGKLTVLDKITISEMERAGFTYLETKRASLPDISFLKRNNWNKHFKKNNLPLIDWEEVTFYIKEDKL